MLNIIIGFLISGVIAVSSVLGAHFIDNKQAENLGGNISPVRTLWYQSNSSYLTANSGQSLGSYTVPLNNVYASGTIYGNGSGLTGVISPYANQPFLVGNGSVSSTINGSTTSTFPNGILSKTTDIFDFLSVGRTSTSTIKGGSTSTFPSGIQAGQSDFTGAVTGISLSEIEDLTADKTFTMANKTLTWNFTNPVGGMLFNMTGAGSSHFVEINQNTGNPSAGSHLLHIMASDSDVVPLHLQASSALGDAQWSFGNIVITNNTASTTLSAGTTSTFSGPVDATSFALNGVNLTSSSTFTLGFPYNPAVNTLSTNQIRLPYDCKIGEVIVISTSSVATTPMVIDVNYINAAHTATTTLFTTQGERPQLDNGGFVSSTVPDVLYLTKGQLLNAEVDQSGGFTSAPDIQIICAKTL